MKNVLVMDIEANGLLDTISKIHCSVFRNLNEEVVAEFIPINIHKLPDYLKTVDVVIGHNIINYDFPAITKVLGFKYTGQMVDTLLMSRLLQPKRLLPPNAKDKKAGPHSLYAWGVRCGVDKPEHEDWENYSSEMLHRCKEDTLINVKTYFMLMKEVKGLNWNNAFKMTFKLFECLQKQEEYGWKFDDEFAAETIDFLDRRIDRIDSAIGPRLPMVCEVLETKVKGEYKFVKEPFLKSGAYNQHVCKYWGEGSQELALRIVGGPYSRISFRRVDLNSNDETKDYLLNLGWEPLEWNTNDAGERTSPKLSKDDPFDGVQGSLGRLIALRVQTRQRQSIVRGLRLLVRPDGAIPSVISNLAETSRAIHRNIVNIPKASSYLGKRMRRLFIAREGKVLVSTDSDSCQLRMLGGRMGSADYIKAITTGDKSKGTDLHSLTKKIAEVESRDLAKNVIYCLLFGGGDTKLGKTAKKPGEGAHIRLKLYQGFDGLGEHVENLKQQWRSTAKKRWSAKWNKMEYYDGFIIGLDGRPVKVPYEHQLLVYELQSDEAIMMSAAYIKCFSDLSKRFVWGKQWAIVCWYHDEYTIECDPDIAEEVKKISEDAIAWAGNYFKIKCPHKGDGKIGRNWYEVH